MSYKEEREKFEKKWREGEFKRLFMQLLPKTILGTVVSVVAVTVATSQVFRQPNVDFNHIYIEEETLHYELYIDALDSNIDVDSLVIRLESNREIQENEGVLGLQSGTFSIVKYRDYNLSVRGDSGFGDQVLAERQVKGLAAPVVKMIDFSQNGNELIIDFSLINRENINDGKITIQILNKLQTIYMEDHEIKPQYLITIPQISLNETYTLRIIANIPKRVTLYEQEIKTNSKPITSLYYQAYGHEIFYELSILDHFYAIKSDIKVTLLLNNKPVDVHIFDNNEISRLSGIFTLDDTIFDEYEIVVEAKVGLKNEILIRETIFIPPSVYFNYEVDNNLISGSIEIEDYQVKKYQIYVYLHNLFTNEICKVLIKEDLNFEINFDENYDHYISLVLIKNNIEYELFYPQLIEKKESGFLSINRANIIYNLNLFEYQIQINLENTFDSNEFDSYRFEIIDEFEQILQTIDLNYQNQVWMNVDNPYPNLSVVVYGVKNNITTKLDQRNLDGDVPFAIVNLDSYINTLYYNIVLFGLPDDTQDLINIKITDASGNIQLISYEYDIDIFGHTMIENSGNTIVEVIFDGIVIGGEKVDVFVAPEVSLSYDLLDNIVGNVILDEYLMDEYQLYVYLENIETFDITKTLILEDLSFSIPYDKSINYYIYLVLVINEVEYYLTDSILIEKTLIKSLEIISANIEYNSELSKYQVVLNLASTYYENDFDQYRVEIYEGLDLVITEDVSFANTIKIDILNPTLQLDVAVYGIRGEKVTLLAERILDTDSIFARMNLYSSISSGLLTSYIYLYGPSPTSEATVDIRVTDSKGMVQINTHDYDDFLGDEFVIFNSGVTLVEVIYNDVVIGAGSIDIFLLPEASLSYELLDQIVGRVLIEDYLTDKYEIYVCLENVETYEITKMLILEDLEFILPYDKAIDYYIYLMLVMDEEEYYLTDYLLIEKTLIKSLEIINANIEYNSEEYHYEVILHLESTYYDSDFDQYRFEILGSQGLVTSEDLPYANVVRIQVLQPRTDFQVSISGLKGELTTLLVEKMAIKALTIDKANIRYNTDLAKYEMIINLTSTYTIEDYQLYRFEISDGISIINSADLEYGEILSLDVSRPNSQLEVTVYGINSDGVVKLCSRKADNELVYAVIDVTPGIFLTYQVSLFGTPINPEGLIGVKLTDSNNEVSLVEPIDYTTFFEGVISANNYGDATLEVLYDGTPIGMIKTFVYPEAYIEAMSESTSMIVFAGFYGVDITEPVRIEVYLDNQLIASSLGHNIVVENAVDKGNYEIRVIIVKQIEYIILVDHYQHLGPLGPEQIRILNGVFVQDEEPDSELYFLYINYEHTMSSPEANYKLYVYGNNELITEGYEVDLMGSFFKVNTTKTYQNVTVKIYDLDNKLIVTSENIKIY